MTEEAVEPQVEGSAENRLRRTWAWLDGHSRWFLAGWLLLSLTAGLVMRQASDLLGSVQSENESAYTMDALVRVPQPPQDDQIVSAFKAWRAAATSDADDPAGLNTPLLELIESWVTWHVLLDIVLFAPGVALLLGCLFRVGFPTVRNRLRYLLPALYLVADWTETILTWALASRFLDPRSLEVVSSGGTRWLVALISIKWFLLLVSLMVVTLALLIRENRFDRLRDLTRMLWAVRVQVVCVSLFAVLIALPLTGALDQVPDLLRSAHDESWKSSDVWVPGLLLLCLCGLVWSSGMQIVRELAREAPASDPTSGAVDTKPHFGYLLWLLLIGALIAAAWFFGQPEVGLRASPGIWAATTVAIVLLVVALLVAWLKARGTVTGTIEAAPPQLTSANAAALEWTVTVLSAVPLAAAGLGAVRAYAPLVLLQSGDPTRAVHDGAWGWFAFGCVSVVVGPLLAVLVLRVIPLDPLRRFDVDHRVLTVLTLVVVVLSIAVAVDPIRMGGLLEAHGVVALWLGFVISTFGLLQWISERTRPVAVAELLGMRRTPWIACVILIPLVSSSLDGEVGYHAVTLAGAEAEPVSLEDAFDDWYKSAKECRKGAEELPLVLVAAPGGGARAAYWTGQVMSRLQRVDHCKGSTVFVASGVSGGSVGLAVWSAQAGTSVGTEDEPDPVVDDTQAALEGMVGPKAISATVATMLFRDLPRSFTGIHPYNVDRAAVEQDVWEVEVPGLKEPFYRTSTDPWRSLLVLNSSDIATGCKVLVSQIDVASDEPAAAQACKRPPDAEGDPSSALRAGAVDAAQFLDSADCTENSNGNLSTAAAALLSARFPYVSPSGALTACSDAGGTPERLFAADGGYLENSGLHTLLAIWQDLEPLVTTKNAKEGKPNVVPLAVLVDNHYRSAASLRPGDRVRELTGPPSASRTALLGIEALEQAFAAEFSQILPGVEPDGLPGSPRWFVIAPSTRPDISAPLGWSLSKAARQALDCQIDPALVQPGDTDLVCADETASASAQVARLVSLIDAP